MWGALGQPCKADTKRARFWRRAGPVSNPSNALRWGWCSLAVRNEADARCFAVGYLDGIGEICHRIFDGSPWTSSGEGRVRARAESTDPRNRCNSTLGGGSSASRERCRTGPGKRRSSERAVAEAETPAVVCRVAGRRAVFPTEATPGARLDPGRISS